MFLRITFGWQKLLCDDTKSKRELGITILDSLYLQRDVANVGRLLKDGVVPPFVEMRAVQEPETSLQELVGAPEQAVGAHFEEGRYQSVHRLEASHAAIGNLGTLYNA